MAEKIKVINPHQHTVYIVIKGFGANDREIPVKGSKDGQQTFALLTEDELAYVMNNSKAIQKGLLKIDASKVPVEVIKELNIKPSPNAMADVDIESLLKASAGVIKKAVAEMDYIPTLTRVLEKAREMDKPVKLIELMEQRIEEIRTK